MKKLFLLFVITSIIVSCQDKKTDWATIDLPIPLTAISNQNELLPYTDYDNMKLFKSFDKNLLFLDGTALDGKVLAENHLILYVSNADKNIVAVTFYIEDENNTDKLLNIIDKKLGQTDYNYRYDDNKKLITTRKIWKKDGKYYTLGYNNPDYIFGKKTKTAQFTIFNANSSVFVRWWFYDGGDFSEFYGQYLDESKKPEHQNKKYTYKDFVEQMDKDNKNEGTTSEYFVK